MALFLLMHMQYNYLIDDIVRHRKAGNTMKPLKSKVSITLDEDIIEKIKTLAEADERSFSQYINLVLKEHIAVLEATEQDH